MCTMTLLLSLALLFCATCSPTTEEVKTFSTCCTRVSAAKPKAGTVIENFIIQKEDLPCVHAVMFITGEGMIMCSNPSVRWVKLKIQELRKRNEEINNNEGNRKEEQ